MGATDVPLNALGMEQARSVADVLHTLGVGVIYSSPLQRCQQTAQHVSDKLALPFKIAPGLRERGWGVLEGRPKSERRSNHEPKGSESEAEFRARIFATLESMNDDLLPLLVTHSGVIRTLLPGRFSNGAIVPHAQVIQVP
jgi:probable phosphoglycerate mutase